MIDMAGVNMTGVDIAGVNMNGMDKTMIETRKNKHKAGIIRTKRIIFALSIVLTVVLFNASSTYMESLFPFRLLGLEPAEGSTEVSSSIQLLIIITILALAPSIVIMINIYQDSYHTFIYEKCPGNPADAAKPGDKRSLVFNIFYNASCVC